MNRRRSLLCVLSLLRLPAARIAAALGLSGGVVVRGGWILKDSDR